ncbi:MAG: protein kinase domain-containing protein [Blastocatellia bacterium]
MMCPSCGNASENTRFCRYCGTELLQTQTPIAPVADSEGAVAASPTPASIRLSQSSDALIGRTLDQRYRLESKLGAGGMGVVFRARRLLLGDEVAIKVLHSELVADAQAVERFRREAQAAALLKHPNVATIYDFGVSSDGLVYLVMELVEGENLRGIIRGQGPLAQVTAAEIVSQVCAALDEAHRQRLVHRDLKPENIVVWNTSRGLHVKALDFGISILRDLTTSRLTPSGSVMGTPDYMSPEQCQGEELDGRSDIYSLGIILYEMLTGVAPFSSPTPTAIVVKHVTQPPPSLRNLNPNISPAVEAVVLHALEKRRQERPQIAGELAREMLAAVSNAPWSSSQPTMLNAPSGSVPAYDPAPTADVPTPPWGNPVTPSFELPTETKKSNLVPLLIGLLLVLAAGGGLGFWLFSGKDKPPSTTAATPTPANNQPAPIDSRAPAATPGPRVETQSPSLSNNLWELIGDQTTETINAENALGEPDQKAAAVKPGGQIAIDFRAGQFFGDGAGADLRVYGPEGERVSYTVFVRDNPTEPWKHVDINRRGFPFGGAGHDIGHHGVRRARQVMIRNDGGADLHIDAVAAVYKDTVGGAPEHHHRH